MEVPNIQFFKIKGIALSVLRKVNYFLPQSFKKIIFKVLFLLSNDPRWGLRLAKTYLVGGKKNEAITIYKKNYALVHDTNNNYLLKHRLTLQFNIQNELYKLGNSSVDDPLFNVKIVDNDDGINKVYFKSAAFSIKKVYSGLKLTVILPATANQGCAEKSGSVDIFLNGELIRKHKIEPKSGLSFNYKIPRPTVKKLPVKSTLSVKTSDGILLNYNNTDGAVLEIPHGTGEIMQDINDRGLLDKKGYIRLLREELSDRQKAYLKLYSKARQIFDDLFDQPLFLIYGTLLGFIRDGDFIPGDDDFDVGYVSHKQDPLAAKAELTEMIYALVKAGLTVAINPNGKPFRLRERDGDHTIHLDVRPVWYQAGKIWAHKQACLPLTLKDFDPVQVASWYDTPVYIPGKAEKFLEAYYGIKWNIPDPGYYNPRVSPEIKRNLVKNYFKPQELIAIQTVINKLKAENLDSGDFISMGLHHLYPLELYEANCGF